MDPQTTLRQFLDLPVWTAFDVDDEGRVLAGTDATGSLQLVELRPDGTRSQLTDLPSRCTGRYVPGRRVVVVQHDQGGDEKTQLSLLRLDPPLDHPAALDDLEPLVHDAAHMHDLRDVTPDAVVFSTNRRNGVDMDVVVRDLDTGDERVVYDDGGYVGGAVVSHDLTRVAATLISLQPCSTALTLSADGESRHLTDPDEHALHDALGFTADDSGLLVASNHGREFCALWRLGLGDDLDWRLLVDDPGHDLHAWPAPDGSAMVVGANHDGTYQLRVHEPDGAPRCDLALPDDCAVAVTWSPGAAMLVVVTTGDTDPGSVWLADPVTGAATRLLDGREALPDGVPDRLARAESHRCPTPDGEEVPVLVHRPSPDADPALAGASVLVIHGGPESQAYRGWGAITQALCAAGITVITPNVRGSTGYGKRWYSLDDVELRLDSVADLAAIRAWLPGQGLDPERSALWGGSYGGYMVLSGLTMQPDLWACGVDIVGMSSLVTFLENTSDYRRAVREREYGSLEHHHDFLVAASPLTHLAQLRAPLFVIHGANDPRVPLSEAEQIKAALDERGVECVLKVYDDEGHGLAKRPNRIDAYSGALDFVLRQLARPAAG